MLSPGSLCSACVCLVWCCCVYCSNLTVSAVSWSFSSLTGKDALFEARSRGWSFRLKLKLPSRTLILTRLSPRRREHRTRFRDSSRFVCTLIIGENSLLIINYKLIKIQRHLKLTKYWTDWSSLWVKNLLRGENLPLHLKYDGCSLSVYSQKLYILLCHYSSLCWHTSVFMRACVLMFVWGLSVLVGGARCERVWGRHSNLQTW